MTNGIVVANGRDVIVTQVQRAETLLERMRGLLGRPRLTREQGFWLEPCNSIHTFGMRYALDVIFLNANGTIIKRVEKLDPWRMSAALSARAVLELPGGAIERSGLAEVTTLHWRVAS